MIEPETYEPREVFSPSGLSLAGACLRSWGIRYLLGMKRPELSWDEAQALEKPVPKKKSKPTAEEAAALKAYNRVFRPALGTAAHARLQAYYPGEQINWTDRLGQIILAGQCYLPHPDECESIEAEGEITIEVSGVRFRGFRDLLVLYRGAWLLIDHKTTYSFDYFDREKTQRTVKSVAELRADWQANLYAFAVMRDKGLSELACRWVYYRTEGAPKAEAVNFVITMAEATAVVAELVRLAKELIGHIHAAPAEMGPRRLAVLQMPGEPGACGDFGGRECHHERGGPCHPPELTPGEKMARLSEKQKAKAARPPRPPKPPRPRAAERRRSNMGFRDAKKAADEAKVAGVKEIETQGEPAPENAGETGPQPPPAVKKPGVKKPRATVSEDGPSIAIVVEGGPSLDLPRSSPLYAQAAAVFAALYPEG